MLAAFGGVEPKALVFLAGIVLSNAWFYGSLGLLASSWAPTLLWTIGFAAGAAIAWNVFLGLPGKLGLATVAGFTDILRTLDVVEGMFVLGVGWFSIAGAHIAANAALGTVLLIAAAVVFRFTATMERRRKEAPEESPAPATPGERRKHRAAGFGRGILAKEIVSRRVVFTLLPFVLFPLIWVTAFFSDYRGPGAYGPYRTAYRFEYLWRDYEQCRIFGLEAAVLLFIVSLRAAAFVSREKEQRTLELLVLTRLGKVRILAGKAAAALVEQVPGFFILVMHMLYVLHVGLRHREELLFLPMAFPLAVVFSVALGLYFGLAAKHVVTAVSLTAFTWFFGATLGPGAAAVTRSAPGAGQVAAVVPYFFVAGGVVIAAAVLILARRGGYGSWLPAVAYSIIAGAIAYPAARLIGRLGAQELLETTWMLPVASLPTFTEYYRVVASRVVVVSCIQIGLLAWMILSGLLGFEAQAKRT
ncbi:MAG: hypothetical protein ACYTAN_16980, partial [Planctomycetota bacterium]|jgi:hypothetical protein